MDFQPVVEVPSRVIEGVTFVLRKMSPARRAEMHLATAEHREKVRAIWRERRPLDLEYTKAWEKARPALEARIGELEAGGLTHEEAVQQAFVPLELNSDRAGRRAELLADEQAVDRHCLRPALIRALFVSIAGFTIGAKAPTADELIESGPEDLVDEIAEACAITAEMRATQQKNWQWPGTSTSVEAGPGTNTSAGPAASEGNSADGAVGSNAAA